MSETPPGEDDATLVRCIAGKRDKAALNKLMEKYAPKVIGYLTSQFEDQLKHPEIDQAVNDGTQNLWRSAHTFNIEKGTFGELVPDDRPPGGARHSRRRRERTCRGTGLRSEGRHLGRLRRRAGVLVAGRVACAAVGRHHRKRIDWLRANPGTCGYGRGRFGGLGPPRRTTQQDHRHRPHDTEQGQKEDQAVDP